MTIGPGAQLDSAGVLYLQSNVGESTQLSASSSITGTSYDQKSKTAGSQHKTAISVALSIADSRTTRSSTSVRGRCSIARPRH